ncbi:hypothetical protein A2U01_0062063, partial [Trifolium medium]|nr:hypothetical protein [Trifolium medium]
MDYSNFSPPFSHHPINNTVAAPSPFHPFYNPPFYFTNTPLTTPSPTLCFNHGYTPPSLTPSSSATTLP